VIHVLDYQTDRILDWLDNSEKKMFWGDNHSINLKDNKEKFHFIMPSTISAAESFTKRNRIIIPDEDGFLREFIIDEVYQDRLDKEVYTVASYTELNKLKIIDPIKLEGQTVNTSLDYVLDLTGWERGITEYVGSRTIEFETHTKGLDALRKLAGIFGLELRFRIEKKNGKVLGRFVDLIKRVGAETKKEIELGKDLIDIKRREISSNIITGLIVLGPEKEEGTRNIVRVEDEDALQRWGNDGRHLWDLYEPSTNDSDILAERLTELGEAELKKRINTTVEYEANAASIEHIFGFEHEKVRLGDTNRIKDTNWMPPLYLDARVISVERSISDKSQKKFILGDFIEYKEEDVMKAFRLLKSLVAKKAASSDIDAVKEYVDQQDSSLFDDATYYTDQVAETKKAEAVEIAEFDATNKANQAEQNANDYTDTNAVKQSDYQLQIDVMLQDIASKAGLEYVNGELSSKANTVDTYTITQVDEALNGKVSSTTYTTDINGIVQDLSDHETWILQNRDGIGLKADNTTVNTLTGRISDAEANLEVQAGQIQSRVTKDEFENLKIGGRNLIIRSAETEDHWINLDGSVAPKGGHDTSDFIEVTPGEEIVITKKTSVIYTDNFFRYGWFDSNKVYISRAATSDDEYKLTVPTGAFYIRISYPTDSYPKLEKGNKATDWTPAPEDIDVRIENAETLISQQADEIELMVQEDGIIGAINLSAETARIKFENIDLVGQVTASHIKSLNGLNVNDQFVIGTDGNVLFSGNVVVEDIASDRLVEIKDGFVKSVNKTILQQPYVEMSFGRLDFGWSGLNKASLEYDGSGNALIIDSEGTVEIEAPYGVRVSDQLWAEGVNVESGAYNMRHDWSSNRYFMAPYTNGTPDWTKEFGYDGATGRWYVDTGFESHGDLHLHNGTGYFTNNGHPIVVRNETNGQTSIIRFRENDNTEIGYVGHVADDMVLKNYSGTVKIDAVGGPIEMYSGWGIYYLSGGCRINTSGNIARWQLNDSNYILQDSSQIRFYMGGSVRHTFVNDGTKSGGSVEVDGKNLGMSPIDSPQVLLEYIEFDVPLSEVGTKVYVDETFLKTVGNFAAFPSNGDIIEKGVNYFVITGTVGRTSDVRIVGERSGYEGSFYADLDSLAEDDKTEGSL
jgi:phage minor structural protein